MSDDVSIGQAFDFQRGFILSSKFFLNCGVLPLTIHRQPSLLPITMVFLLRTFEFFFDDRQLFII